MGDDFDLFPKRENLDPFSFGKKEKTTEPEKAESEEELFGQEEQPSAPLPEPPPDLPPDLSLDHLTVDSRETTPSLPDLPLGGPDAVVPPPASEMPLLDPPPSTTPPAPDAVPDLMEGILSGGPISEEKTFDEPVLEQEQDVKDTGERISRKSPSPFVIIGGALIIIIGLLYGALTYLKKDKAVGTLVATPPVSIAVVQPTPEPAPVPEPETATAEVQTDTQPAAGTTPSDEAKVTPSKPEGDPTQETAPVVIEPTPEPGSSSAEAAADKPAPALVPVVASGETQYSVQVGAFILDSSVAQLEKKLRGLGYDPFLKEGSTTAMMNMLTVGPFGKIDDARAALSRLKEAGVDSNMRRRSDGTAIINGGSYLLEENANSIMKKIRSLGYPVKLLKREARLPMTFVRVGHYPGMDDATSAKEELKGKGLDGVVVKLQ